MKDVDFIFAGDLLNQCIASAFSARGSKVPYIGLYGACSTFAEAVGLSAVFADSAAKNCLAVASSHFCSAERQYRFPLEYGGQRPPSSQWTATAAGAAVVSKDAEYPFIKAVTFGTVEDLGINDQNNMGAAMAPAAAATLSQFFRDTYTLPSDYDLIVTGDLGYVGSNLMLKLMEKEGFPLGENYNDCGLMLYEREKQQVESGASGCGCSASVLSGHILPKLKNGVLKNVLAEFRTVSMALIVLQVTVPLLGFYVLDRIIKEKYTSKEFMKAGVIAYALTGLFCLVCALFPGIAGTFTGAVDAGQPDILVDALIADRQTLLSKDAWHSFWFITIVCALILWAYRTPKNDAVGKDGSFVRKGRMVIVAVAMVFLVYIDLVSVGKRYLNKSHFITPRDFTAVYEPRPVDEIILQDSDPDYRVLDISVNTFNDAIPSYHHKTIGGYSPVKMQRYQDLIERYLTSEIRSVYGVLENAVTVQDVTDSLPLLKMTSALNGKYIVLGAEYPPVENRHAFGNAWFVSSCVPAATPDEEIALLASTDLRNTAVIGDDFAWAREAFAGASSDDATSDENEPAIALTHYAPNELRYDFRTGAACPAIFSEIYCPMGWKAWIEPAGAYGEVRDGHYKPTADAKPVELFRADWILRGAVIPAGEGQLIMRFEPDSYQLGENISRASSAALILLLLLSAGGMLYVSRKNQ